MSDLDKKGESDLPVPPVSPDDPGEERPVAQESAGVSGAEVGGSAEQGKPSSFVATKPCDSSKRVGSLARRKILAGKIRATSDVGKTMYVDMFEYAWGCPEFCAACGAYEGNEERMVIGELSPDQIRANVRKQIGETALRIIDLLRRFITMGIDAEPLFTKNFCEWAKIIREESVTEKEPFGHSRGVCISHGLHYKKLASGEWVCPRVMKERLGDIVELMMNEHETVPLFALSCDLQRQEALMGVPPGLNKSYKALDAEVRLLREKLNERYPGYPIESLVASNKGNNEVSVYAAKDGELDKLRQRCFPYTIEANKRSYVETLIALAKPIRSGKRVTVSLQGDDSPKTLVYTGAVMKMWNEACQMLQGRGYGDLVQGQNAVNIDPVDQRLFSNLGRAKTVLGGLAASRHCPVIPDMDFLRHIMWSDLEPYRGNRAILDVQGRVLVQVYRAMSSYDDSIDGFFKELDLDGGKTATNGGGEG